MVAGTWLTEVGDGVSPQPWLYYVALASARTSSFALTHRPVRLLSSAASMNFMPLAPSSTVGKSSESGSQGARVRRATIASAASRYRVANVS
jgi:hypothetical protein